MILSTQTDVTAARFGLVGAIPVLAQAGFDAIDISMFSDESTEPIYSDGWQDLAAEMNETAKVNGVYFNQAHAPFPTIRPDDAEYSERTWPMVERAIRFAGLCGVKNIVVHPVFFPEDCKAKNMEMYNRLAPVAKEAGVKIALENMWGRDRKRNYIVPNVCSVPEDLADYYDGLDPDIFTVCLDLGHCGLVGVETADFIRYLGADRLTCLHIHDNNYREDSHQPPFTFNREYWNGVARALRDIGYRGDFTLEADNFLKHMPEELMPSGLRYMNDTGRQLIKMFETE